MKTFIVNGSFGYHRLFTLLGHQIVDKHQGCELMVFTGGEDVSPMLYGDKAHQQTGNNPYRDSVEKEYFQYAQDNGIPCVGICRG